MSLQPITTGSPMELSAVIEPSMVVINQKPIAKEFQSFTDLIFKMEIPTNPLDLEGTHLVGRTMTYLSNEEKYTFATCLTEELVDVIDWDENKMSSFNDHFKNVQTKLINNLDWLLNELNDWKEPSCIRVKRLCEQYKQNFASVPPNLVLQCILIHKVRQFFPVIKGTGQYSKEYKQNLKESNAVKMFKEEVALYDRYLNTSLGVDFIAMHIQTISALKLKPLKMVSELRPGMIVSYITDHSPDFMATSRTSYGRILSIKDKLICLRDHEGNPKEILLENIQNNDQKSSQETQYKDPPINYFFQTFE